MRTHLKTVAVIMLLLITCGCSVSNKDLSVKTSTWVSNIDWSKYSIKDNQVEFINGSISPLDPYDFLSKYEMATIQTSDNGNREFMPAVEILHYTGEYYGKEIKLYNTSDGVLSKPDLKVYVLYKNKYRSGKEYNLAGQLNNREWYISSEYSVFDIPPLADSLDDTELLNSMLESYGKPSKIGFNVGENLSEPRLEYTVLWGTGSDYFGVEVSDTVSGQKAGERIIYKSVYYSKPVIEIDRYHNWIDFDNFLDSLNMED